MPGERSRDEASGLDTEIRRLLSGHRTGEITTETVRDGIERMIADAAGQLGEIDRRAVAGFAERLISRFWAEQIDLDQACACAERVVAAAAGNSSGFQYLIRAD